MGKLSLSKTARIVLVLCAATAIPSAAQTLTTLASFNGTNGAYPYPMSLVQGTDGNFYGTASQGGGSSACILGCGTVFKITPGGALTTLHTFAFTDGAFPLVGLTQGTDGNFYGTTSEGEANNGFCTQGCGTVFKITPGGTLTTLHNFGFSDGALPAAGLIQATDGNFYATTAGGGNPFQDGTVFKITLAGTLTTLHLFDGINANFVLGDGYSPTGSLVQGTDGNFYGTTESGPVGASCCGTVFKITPGGTLTTLHEFQGYPTDGSFPYQAGLVQGTDGNLYGTTSQGGANDRGTVFKITPGATLTTLYSFSSSTADQPRAGLVLGTDGNFYGTTSATIFKITPTGSPTTLYTFCSQTGCTDGAAGPQGAGLLQATDGNFYGTTAEGGANGQGTVFRLAVGLAPFVETRPTSGAVGAAVIILGNNLTGATGVKFNGTTATFSVVSSTEIQTTVPVGATTGIVQVTTPSGTLNSNVPFQVTKTRKRLVQVTSE